MVLVVAPRLRSEVVVLCSLPSSSGFFLLCSPTLHYKKKGSRMQVLEPFTSFVYGTFRWQSSLNMVCLFHRRVLRIAFAKCSFGRRFCSSENPRISSDQFIIHTTNGQDSVQNASFFLLKPYFESIFDAFETCQPADSKR